MNMMEKEEKRVKLSVKYEDNEMNCHLYVEPIFEETEEGEILFDEPVKKESLSPIKVGLIGGLVTLCFNAKVITITSHAVAVLAPNDNGVAGVVHFTQEGDTVHIDYDITGLTDGEHGFHIHTYGDLTDGCSSACAHFNPDNTEHGGLDSEIRHLGDLGNISSEKGVSKGRLSTDTLSLVLGKGMAS